MDIQRFHQDLKAATFAGAPVELAERWRLFGSKLTLARIEQLEKRVSPLVGNGRSPADAATALRSNTDLPKRYRAALQTFGIIDTMVPVLDGLSSRKNAHQEVARTLRWAFIYLFGLLCVALVGLLFYWWKITPLIHDVRADLLLIPAITAEQQFDTLPWIPVMAVSLMVFIGLMVLWVLFGGISRVAMWLGGRHYVRCRTSATALRNIELLANSGMAMPEALDISCDLTGADGKVRSNLGSVVRGNESGDQLRELAEYFHTTANQRMGYMKVATPVLLISIFGGLVAAFYCVAIYWPVVAMIHELVTAGVPS